MFCESQAEDRKAGRQAGRHHSSTVLSILNGTVEWRKQNGVLWKQNGVLWKPSAFAHDEIDISDCVYPKLGPTLYSAPGLNL